MKESSKRIVDVHIDEESKYASDRERRHLVDAQTRRSETARYPTVDWKAIRKLEPNPAKEFVMEEFMNRKIRVPTVDALRNGIPVASQGDKYYKEADREPGFYQTGGIVVGSTIQNRKVKKGEMKKNEINLGVPPHPPLFFPVKGYAPLKNSSNSKKN
jgi:hypothetical protein